MPLTADSAFQGLSSDISATRTGHREARETTREPLGPMPAKLQAHIGIDLTGGIAAVSIVQSEAFHGTVNMVLDIGKQLDQVLFVDSGSVLQPHIFLMLLVALSVGVYAVLHRLLRSKSKCTIETLQIANRALTAELARREHAEARMLEESAAKTRLIAALSHEIRTPINATQGLFELLEQASIPEKHVAQARHGRLATERLMALLTNILETARMNEKMVRIHRKTTRLQDLSDHWRSLLTASLARYGTPIEGAVTLHANGCQALEIDEMLTSQIVGNLVDNAIKYSSQGQIEITISVDGPNDAGRDPVLQVQVTDSGPGIPKDRWPDIFRRFYQIDDDVTQPRLGAGLGLALSREFADLMNGRLDLTDSHNGGTTFTLTLPAQRVAEDILTGPSAASRTGPAPAPARADRDICLPSLANQPDFSATPASAKVAMPE